MRQALTGFQKSRNLQATGKLDDATWNALNQDTTATLVNYTSPTKTSPARSSRFRKT
jgi:peptidoglycan hydrolase-like protein with peptidoglycan-binding domain